MDSRAMSTQWSEIYINRDYFANCTYPACNGSVQHVFAHESGHAMMLAHNPLDTDAIMGAGTGAQTVAPNGNDIGAYPGCSGVGLG
jgi:hypothetical protein